jgi:cell division protein FtsQ
LLGLFGPREGGASRRYFKLLKQRCKVAGFYVAAALVVTGASTLLWKSGSIARIAAAAQQRVVSATSSAGFKVADIRVSGRSRVPEADILARLDINKGMPVFSADLTKARKDLLGLPWVKDAHIARRLPGAILVTVTERTPFALWQRDKKISVVDEDGVVLPGADLSAFGNLPLVVGEGAASAAAALLDMLRAEPSIASMVASAARIGVRRWDLHLKNGVVVMLPAADEGLALARLARAQQKTALLDKPIMRVDLRLPDRLVVRPGAAKKDNKENI